jgi:hypothetical protein
MSLLRLANRAGLLRHILPQISHSSPRKNQTEGLPKVFAGSLGILLGSPEHRDRRAIASYQTAKGWEVAKIAFGPNGWDVIRGESRALESLPQGTKAAPVLSGVHREENLSLMRMPYLQGTIIPQGETSDGITLLESWISDLPAKPVLEFPEWPFIESALMGLPDGQRALEQLSQLHLKPCVRHGDFARWNLLRIHDGTLMALDWEWGTASGMPGIDLVHYFAQDARLVDRRIPTDVCRATEEALNLRACRDYLQRTGWGDQTGLAILASIAFTVGAEQQANTEVLAASLKVILA